MSYTNRLNSDADPEPPSPLPNAAEGGHVEGAQKKCICEKPSDFVQSAMKMYNKFRKQQAEKSAGKIAGFRGRKRSRHRKSKKRRRKTKKKYRKRRKKTKKTKKTKKRRK
tara:strand:+ start:4034 stop:4363 length:330 start_codon:yes stop_codon:yes gene_type:complete